MTIATSAPVDLRLAPLAVLRSIDFRSPARDFWADEAAIWQRFVASWAGLDDAAWRLPGAAPSDAGGPDWSLLDHVAHVLDWHEIADEYIRLARSTGRWPSDEDYDGGDFDTFNEHRRERFAALPPAGLRERLDAAHARLLRTAADLAPATIRSDEAWGWVYMVLHGHALDHLAVIEPWADRLRIRQVQNDPFGPDPQPTKADRAAAIERFWADEASVVGQFEAMIRAVPTSRWRDRAAAGGWSLADHVGHLARWFEVGAAALEDHRRTGRWAEMPPEGLDVFNEREVAALREAPVETILARYEAGLARLRQATRVMTPAEWLDPEGFSWAYEDLHGHIRAHLAMVGPWCARAAWPVVP